MAVICEDMVKNFLRMPNWSRPYAEEPLDTFEAKGINVSLWTCAVPRFQQAVSDWLRSGRCICYGQEFVSHPSLQIGSGGEAVVYIGFRVSDGADMALKVFSEYVPRASEKDVTERWRSEIRMLRTRALIPGVVQYHGQQSHSFYPPGTSNVGDGPSLSFAPHIHSSDKCYRP
jgi:hypothetical protein